MAGAKERKNMKERWGETANASGLGGGTGWVGWGGEMGMA
jgi:hypothetical protein